ncbi:hypothetical protein GCM10011583_10730 [Streptomyces camponoticapitis]|uniref:Secreted protein n=1 Tax=Streptomyces camponoticapitis TaxID=1616125 RepID=A0ABQ2DZV9_9ACTN|nr:hypothetical protein GCM10011583_10730 [Streptomyces camponoticapitis]
MAERVGRAAAAALAAGADSAAWVAGATRAVPVSMAPAVRAITVDLRTFLRTPGKLLIKGTLRCRKCPV